MVKRQQGKDVSAKLMPGSFLVVGRRGCHCFCKPGSLIPGDGMRPDYS